MINFLDFLRFASYVRKYNLIRYFEKEACLNFDHFELWTEKLISDIDAPF